MKFTKQNLDAAVTAFFPESSTWKVDTVTLAKMVVEELFCFPEKYSNVSNDHVQMIRTALTQLKQVGWMTFVEDTSSASFKVGDKVVRDSLMHLWCQVGYLDSDIVTVVGIDESEMPEDVAIKLVDDSGHDRGWWTASYFRKVN